MAIFRFDRHGAAAEKPAENPLKNPDENPEEPLENDEESLLCLIKF